MFTEKVTIYLFYRVNWVEVNGITYKPSCVVIHMFRHDMPVFGRIVDIYVFQNHFYLATEVYSYHHQI